MPCVYSVQLPTCDHLDVSQLLRVLERWVNSNKFNSFSNFSFKETNYIRATCAEAELTYARVDHPSLQIALKTETAMTQTDTQQLNSNLLWAAHFLMTCTSSDKTLFHIQLFRSPADAENSCNMNVPIHIPYIFKLLIESGMLKDDQGIPFSYEPLDMDESLQQAIDIIVAENRCTSIPILLLSDCEVAARLAERLSGAAHILISPVAKDISFLFPRIQARKTFPLSHDTQQIENIFNHIIQATYASVPDRTVTFEQIEKCLETNAQSPTSHAEYVFVSAEMRQKMKTQRKKNGLTQAELAKQTGTTGLTISRLERQQSTRVEKGLLHRIENALGLTDGVLLSLESAIELKKESSKKCESSKLEFCSSLFCYRCGAKLIDNARFCHQCGVEVPVFD